MKVRIKAGRERKLLGRYPFGHAGDILDADAGISAGDVVDVHAEGGAFIGRGYFNAEGATPLRMLTLEREDIGEAFYRRRLRAALARREGRITGTDALRVSHAEADGLPGIIADKFGSVLSVQLRNAGVERHRDLILRALREETGATAAFERSDTGERRKEGLDLRAGVLWGDLPDKVTFHEDDLELFFRPLEAQKTGFFLDQRDNRRLMRRLVPEGGTFLDAYSYTGGFSLHAARAGAKAVAVDKDPVALGTLEAVARANGLDRHTGVRLGDAIEVLTQLEREGRTFDAVVLDPPTLAKRKDDVPRAKRVFTDGTARALRMLKPGGHLLISTCAHYIRVDDLLDAARVAASEADASAEVLDVTYQPADHPWLLAVPESLYLKSILLRKD
ncbi:class I SAM-dependent rRNA methyltransferase [Deinococcus maricopensis]|uniref:PUA domain containing protein n=1 Tax=Deinococcus maricopensis (strain DSM 21211 / LMG 22137 / NRRL B-23946 / LB-34) TaxID=709986 RepID=E8U8G9_DEIML|nr:class I SAM-dependent rRNA methyltransferase [Deinococcus maricopensis]ADV67358.1 PUA domain containing protein [Deinococcus maricopensis DSM 21211]